VTSDIFEQCPKLQELHLINCEINKLLLNQWREKYPHVSVFAKIWENYLQYQEERNCIKTVYKLGDQNLYKLAHV